MSDQREVVIEIAEDGVECRVLVDGKPISARAATVNAEVGNRTTATIEVYPDEVRWRDTEDDE